MEEGHGAHDAVPHSVENTTPKEPWPRTPCDHFLRPKFGSTKLVLGMGLGFLGNCSAGHEVDFGVCFGNSSR